MATKARTRTRSRQSTALVFNPGRKVVSGGGKANPAKRRAKTTRRRRSNGTIAKVVARPRVNPRRRRRHNPTTSSGLIITALMAALGVSLFDVITMKFIPQTSSLVRVGVKAGGAWLFWSPMGSKIPFLGKYKNDIALVLAVSCGVDLFKLYVMPVLASTLNNFGIPLLNAPDASAMGDIWNTTGNGFRPSYQPYA